MFVFVPLVIKEKRPWPITGGLTINQSFLSCDFVSLAIVASYHIQYTFQRGGTPIYSVLRRIFVLGQDESQGSITEIADYDYDY